MREREQLLLLLCCVRSPHDRPRSMTDHGRDHGRLGVRELAHQTPQRRGGVVRVHDDKRPTCCDAYAPSRIKRNQPSTRDKKMCGAHHSPFSPHAHARKTPAIQVAAVAVVAVSRCTSEREVPGGARPRAVGLAGERGGGVVGTSGARAARSSCALLDLACSRWMVSGWRVGGVRDGRLSLSSRPRVSSCGLFRTQISKLDKINPKLYNF